MWRRKSTKLPSCRPCVRHCQGTNTNTAPLSLSASILHVAKFSLAVLALRSLAAATQPSSSSSSSGSSGVLRCPARCMSTTSPSESSSSSSSSSSNSALFREDVSDAARGERTSSSFLSPRRIRQLEHQHGPAWRYVMPESSIPQRDRPSQSTITAGANRIATEREQAFIDEWLRLRRAAENSMLVGSSPPPQGAPLGGVASDGNPPLSRPAKDGAETSSTRRPDGEFGQHASSRAANSGASEADPLIEFMERHHEDGEVMLAMWTSLRRSCLYRSELSEATALLVRRVFHTLIRHRAVLAATRLYYRLLEIGVQLSSADVLVLLTNLPYERSTTHAKAQEKEWMSDSNSSWMAKKRAEEEAQRKNTKSSQKRPPESPRRTGATSSDQTSAEMGVSERPEAKASSKLAACSVAPQKSAGTQSQIPVEVAALGPLGAALFDSRPEWIRRWILYEASMGNIELNDEENPLERSFTTINYSDENGALTPQATEGNACESDSAAAASSLDGINDDDTGNFFDGEVLEDKAVMQEAKEAIEITALVSHLLLLQEEADARARGRSVEKTRRVGMASRLHVRNRLSGSSNGRYWAEALSLANLYVSRVSSRTQSKQSVEKSSTTPARVSKEFEEGVRVAVAASNSWKVSLHYMENIHGVFTPVPKDAITFMDLAAPHAPWKKSPAVESFVHGRVIPLLEAPNAASYAAKAIWNAHVCLIKQESPDTYICRFNETESLAVLLRNAVAAARLSASHLAIEATRLITTEKVNRTMSASEKGGLFTDHSTAKHTSAVADVDATAFASHEQLVKEPRIRLMPVELQRTMRLVGEAVAAVAWLAPVLAEAENLGEGAVPSLVSDTLYGDYGLLQTFAMFYDVQSNDPRLTRRAEERAEVAEALCYCVLDVVLSITQIREDRTNSQRMAHLANPGLLLPQDRLAPVPQVADLLLQVTHLLVHVTRGRNPVARVDLARLQSRIAHMAKRLLVYLGIVQNNQMTLFGSSAPEVVAAIAMFVRASHIVGMRAVWGHLLPSAKHALRVATSQTNACGKMVCRELLDVELRDVHDVIHSSASRRRERGAVKLRTQQPARMSAPQSINEVKRILSPTDLKQVQAQAEVNSLVAAALRSSRGASSSSSADLDAALQSLVSSPNASWETSLRVTSSVLKHWRVPLNSVSVDFFRAVIETLARDSMRRPSSVHRSTSPSATSSSSWLNAIAVFWAAVDHTGQKKSPKQSDHAKKQHEKDVLTELIVPLVRVAAASGREGVARQWSRSWQAMYHGDEKKSKDWELVRARVLVASKDHRALRACAKAREQLVSSSDVDPQQVRSLDEELRNVSMWHVNWWEALSTLQHTYAKPPQLKGTMSAKNAEDVENGPFDTDVVPTLLRVLRRCPKNLTRTAQKLYETQGSHWDASCSVELLRIIVRARQWVAALQHISDVSAQGLIPSTESVSAAVGSTEAASMAALTLCGLQACAIGGRSEEAAALYDDYKQWRQLSSPLNSQRVPQPRQHTRETKPRARLSQAAESIEQMLDSALPENPSDSASSFGGDDDDDGIGSGDSVRSTVHVEDDSDQRARLLFFRAMTKKSIKATESSRSKASKE